ncbi:hypothetical protein P170DRAFT_389270 [Aspergillus steynii IBT 23096]|uniref:SAM and PH domain protein n=1 Tax=Aspergillus steynii IBT 23096 TaxID=1392250 RepID=A0A2I2FXT4_9EURO|nr:uncharacterized protein P170DRAFT_389270 [Aspergillus steynii IBT 23096]PLB45437.1 hypothetical protein P170DRAFT_389270 [Aspergillus steynii IBT 23096]
MESLRGRRKAPPASLNMKHTARFNPPWTAVHNRQSNTTNFDDTDFEFSDSDTESPRMSMGSFGYDSNSSLSTPDLPTPDHAPKAPFNFRLDNGVKGPSGPHLFRSSIGSAGSVSSTEIDLYFERSPVNSRFQQSDRQTPSSQSQFLQSDGETLSSGSYIIHSDNETPSYRSEFSHSQSGTPSYRSQFSHSQSGTPSYRSQYFHSASQTPSSRSQFSQSQSEALSMGSESIRTYSETPSSRSQFSRSETQTPSTRSQFAQSESGTTTSSRYQFSPPTPRAYSTVYPDVSQVEESEIRGWVPSQVAHWLHIAGYDEFVIDQFLINDITGTVLLNLQVDDLKELGIKSFGKRHQLMSSIDHLRNTMMKTPAADEKPQENRRSYAMSVSPTGEVLTKYDGTQITPAEAVSIVGIEQVLPKPHSCSKGENCPKFRRRQRQLERLAAEFPGANLLSGTSIFTGNPGNPETAKNMLRPKSDAEPSIVASSDVFGPSQTTPRLSEDVLNEVSKLDPQESVRHFLSYQRVDPASSSDDDDSDPCSPPLPPPKPEPVPTLSSPPTKYTEHMAANLRSLPKLRIPTDSDEEDELTTATVTTAQPTMYGSPTTTQEHGPFTSSRYMPQGGNYRLGTPFSEMDVPITAIPDDPIARDTSQSVPPDMQYGNLMHLRYQEGISRSASTRPRANSALRPVNEGRPLTPIDGPEDMKKRSPRIGFNPNPNSTSSAIAADPDVTRCGWMKKRKQARFLRHEWQDAHFTLRGTNLAMHKDELAALRHSKALETIDVDDYAVACSSLATSSKLTAAFKKSILRNGQNPSQDDAAFAFSLIPATKENEKKMLFGNGNIKSHHFAVKTRDERIDWMRELMLSKALRKGKEGGAAMQVNGNFI